MFCSLMRFFTASACFDWEPYILHTLRSAILVRVLMIGFMVRVYCPMLKPFCNFKNQLVPCCF